MTGDPDRQQFAKLYDEHVGRVYGFFGYRVASREEAEDLTQLTFERALRAWGGFDPERASPRTWLMAIAKNLLIDHYRRDRASRETPIEEGDAVEASLGHEPPIHPGLGVDPELEAALKGLPERERQVIALRFGGDLTSREIAELTGIGPANVDQIVSRSLRSMRAALEERGTAAGLRSDL